MATEKTVIETVVMQDGRAVDFPGKKQLLKESFVTPEGQVQVRLDFRNGQTRLFTVPPAMLNKFAAHGAEQKLGDQIAGLKDAQGKDADIDDKVLAIDELIDQLYSGDWSVKRESNGLAGTSVLLRALVEVTGKSVDAIKAFLKEKTAAEKSALRNSSKIKPVVDRIEAEKAKKANKIDADALLAGLDGGDAEADNDNVAPL